MSRNPFYHRNTQDTMSISSSWNSFISSTITFQSPNLKSKTNSSSLCITNSAQKSTIKTSNQKSCCSPLDKAGSLLFHCGVVLATVETPAALAVTGENGGDDLLTTVVSSGIIAFLYLFVVPPILMNWMRVRWFKRKFLEMYLQFMCVFIFFPGLLLWAPFVNFRKFPRDPTMKYPWSTPKDDVPLYKIR